MRRAPPAHWTHGPRARSGPRHRQCRSPSLPTTRPTRQSNPWLLLLDACGRCTRTTLYHPERSSHRITGERPQSPHLTRIASATPDPWFNWQDGHSTRGHAVARRRDMSLTLAIYSQVAALSIVLSTSFAKRRLRFSQARVRSTTQRRGSRTKPLAVSDRLTISIVHSPWSVSAFFSLSPA